MQGFFEGEGSVADPGKGISINITNTDKNLVDFCCKCLNVLDIKFTIFYTKLKLPNKPRWDIRISRIKEAVKFAEMIRSNAPHKADRLNKIILFSKQPPRFFRTRWSDEPKPSKSFIQSLVKKGCSRKEIAEKIGTQSINTVQHYKSLYKLSGTYRKGKQPDPVEVQTLYESGKSLRELGEIFGYQTTSIVKFMIRHNIKRKKNGRYKLKS